MFSAEITTFLFGATPIAEIRLAIPWGVTFGNLGSAEAFLWGFLGNISASTLAILLLPVAAGFARDHSKLLDNFFQKLFAKTRKKHSKNFLRFEALFLVILVAIPIPGSGGYTGSLVAWLFGVKPKVAIPLIALGVFFAGLIVLGLTNGVRLVLGS